MAALILCLGNSSKNTLQLATQIANQYSVAVNGLLTQSQSIQPGCYYTDIGTVTVEYLRSIARCFDLIVLLDQPVDSYGHIDSYYQTYLMCSHLKNWQEVILQSQPPWCYIVKYFNPIGDYNIIRVTDNQNLYQAVMTTDLRYRNVVLQLSQVNDFDMFINWINNIIFKCRSGQSKFVMFRADQHEDHKLHFKVTQFLVQIPEFILLTPDMFKNNVNDNLQLAISQHWHKLYH